MTEQVAILYIACYLGAVALVIVAIWVWFMRLRYFIAAKRQQAMYEYMRDTGWCDPDPSAFWSQWSKFEKITIASAKYAPGSTPEHVTHVADQIGEMRDIFVLCREQRQLPV